MRRWITFNVVGALGFGVQLATLWALLRVGAPLVPAVGLAVLVTVSHNFAWHERITWPRSTPDGRLRRWLAFNVSTGLVSVATNVVVTALLVAAIAMPPVVANALAVAAASLVNYAVSDRLIFGRA